MQSKITYHQQVSYCGKPRCRKCREGSGHGPYWYAYQTVEGRTTRTYIGKTLPEGAQSPEQAAANGSGGVGAVSANGAVAAQNAASPLSPLAIEQQSALVRVYTLGQFRLERRAPRDATSWQTVTDSPWQHQRVRALLSCLISTPGRKLPREQLMDTLWPELDSETASNRLDRAVYSLRQLFEPARTRPATSPLLLTEREMLVLADQEQVWVDADAFDHLLVQARTVNDPGAVEKILEDAVRIYGGDFLPEERKIDWTIARRDSLLRGWVGLLLDLADQRASREAHAGAIELLDRLLSIDPTNEAAVQRLVKLLAQQGRRGEALRAYKRLANVLQQEYRISPLPETRALYDTLRSGGSTLPGASTTGSATPGARDLQSSSSTPPRARTSTPPTTQIGRAHQSPLVGREEELDVLRSMVTEAEQAAKFRLPVQKKTVSISLDTQRRPQCVLLMGEVGIGKTRLAEEVSRDARRGGWAVAWSRVYAQEGSIPYRLWTEVLRKAMSQGAWQRQELTRRASFFQPLSTLLPELQEYLPPLSSYTPSPSPEQEQLRLWEAARELLTLISENTPLLIALDDLQWSDGSSCELLAYLARRVQNHPIVIVGTCRDNELAANHPLRPLLTDLQREHAVRMVSLAPLSAEQINTLVSNVPHIPDPLVQRISDRAAGNPFFAEELARTLSVQFSAPDESAQMLPQISKDIDANDEAVLPDTIAAVLDLRLGRLSTACRNLLNKASVLGSSFEFQVIDAMEAATPGSNEDLVLELLEEALKSGMLTEEGTGTRITYQFWHPLLSSHLYEKLSAARRASLHRRAADIFLRTYQGREEEGAATITYHLVRGGAPDQQVAHYAELAGNRDYSLSAYREAERHFRVALEHLGDTKENQERRAYLLELLGECTTIQGNDEEARSFYEQALAIHSKQRIDPSSQEYQYTTQIQALLWCEIGVTWFNVGNNLQAEKCYEQGEQVLRAVNVLSGPAWARLRYEQSYVYWRDGNYEKAKQAAQEALELFKEAVDPNNPSKQPLPSTRIRHTLNGDPVDLGRAYQLLGVVSLGAGQYYDTSFHLTTALNIYEQYDCHREIGIVCCNLGDLHLRQSEYELAHSQLRRSAMHTERAGDIPNLSVVFNNLGIVAARRGDLIEAETNYKHGIALAEKVQDQISLNWLCVYLSNALQDQDRLAEAKVFLHQAIAIGRSTHIAPCIGAALIALGSLRLAQAISEESDENKAKTIARESFHILNKAKSTLQHALAFEGMEAETRTEGQLLLAEVLLLQGEQSNAYQQVIDTLEEARRFELKWLIARAHRVLGSILLAQEQKEQAMRSFEQAIRDFRTYGMRLELARTLHPYGTMLLQQNEPSSHDFKRGLDYLNEARHLFADCKAALDLRLVERDLALYEQHART